MIDNDDDDFRRANYERLFGTTVEAETEAREAAALAERAKHDEVLTWARQRVEVREINANAKHDSYSAGPTDELGRPLNDPRYRLDPDVVTKSYAAPIAPAVATVSKAYVKRQLDQRDRVLWKAVGQTLGTELKALDKTDTEINTKLDAITAQIAELTERISKLEAAAQSTPIRLVS